MDLRNFEISCWSIDDHLMFDYHKIPFFLLNHTIEKYGWKYHNPRLIRAYAYSGEYTGFLMKQLKKYHGEDSEDYKKYLAKAKRQKQIEGWSKDWDFFDLKLKPLKFRDNRPKQKGVDVQLAVDLVSHAYQDNYDVAIVCSGDADLLESMKLVKTLGKKVILVSKLTPTKEGEEIQLSPTMRKHADSLIDLGTFQKEDFEKFTHQYQEYKSPKPTKK